MMRRYEVRVCSDLNTLISQVDQDLWYGWKLHGPLMYVGGEWCQALVRDPE